MAENVVADTEIDALSGLEDRILKAVALVGSLRQERDSLTKDLNEAMTEMERLSNEVSSLREERNQVRSRIEKLLGHIDQISL